MNVLVIGSYGLGNVGDNVCQDVMLDFFRGKGMEVKSCHSPVKRSLVEWADMVILGGGGLLYDSGEVISLRSSNSSFYNRILRLLFLTPAAHKLVQSKLLRRTLGHLPFITTNASAIVDNYMDPIELACSMGKPTAGIALGTQGIHTEYGKTKYARVLSKLDLLTVRDPADEVILRSMGVSPKGGIVVCEDLGWMVKPPADADTEFDVGWVIRWLSAPPGEYRIPVVAAIKELKRQGFTQRILSFSRTDTGFLTDLSKEADLPFFEDLSKDVAIAELSKCGVIVSNRFHATLFSLLMRKPIVVVSTQDSLKSKWLVNRVPLPYSVSAEPPALCSKICEVAQRKQGISPVDLTRFISRSERNLIRLNELIRRAE